MPKAVAGLLPRVIGKSGEPSRRVPVDGEAEMAYRRVGPEARRSGYLKVRDRASYEFALASAAVALDIGAGIIRSARVAVGGVGTVPWRLPAVEGALRGRPPTADVFRGAAALAADGAKPVRENGFKVELLKRTVERQLGTVAAMP